jgi:hypothetical protein
MARIEAEIIRRCRLNEGKKRDARYRKNGSADDIEGSKSVGRGPVITETKQKGEDLV